MSGKNYAALALRGLGESQKNNEGGSMSTATDKTRKQRFVEELEGMGLFVRTYDEPGTDRLVGAVDALHRELCKYDNANIRPWENITVIDLVNAYAKHQHIAVLGRKPEDSACVICSEHEVEEEPCFRSKHTALYGTELWNCDNRHTGCLWNDGYNTCSHDGDSLSPLEEEA